MKGLNSVKEVRRWGSEHMVVSVFDILRINPHQPADSQMRFPIALSVPVVILTIPACGFQSFSGSTCDGDAGLDIPCDGTCQPFDNRHSFRADTSGDAHSVDMFILGGCFGVYFNFNNQARQCTNVNTGTNIRSFRCFRVSASTPPPASAPSAALPIPSTSSSPQDTQFTASISTAPPASAPPDVPPTSPSTNNIDGQGTKSGMSAGKIAGAASGSVGGLILFAILMWCGSGKIYISICTFIGHDR
ncbi:hypothetical protein EXIGLDRAFT_201934 [Exidia glandulosa HHB12029]|uniref:Uncharacterized protein n=1 Tax=Exidia glandulosa HHB12029 TaxID=1314781 RepID=A0A165EPR8_EXIGL|nr:hypothetical protein EXIGLDRAFT_201934 [Exidia glandulosa HHB12029]